MADLDAIVTLLDRHRQRATYGAVAGLLGTPQQSLMKGRPKTPLYSWVVNKEKALPTGYSKEEMHPALEARSAVITDQEALAQWLQEHQQLP